MLNIEKWELAIVSRENIEGGLTTIEVSFNEEMECRGCGRKVEVGDWVRLEKIGTVTKTKEPQLTGRVFCYMCDNQRIILGSLAQVVETVGMQDSDSKEGPQTKGE